MESLPPEMLEHILSFVDGSTLIKAKTVCKNWRDVASFFDKKQKHWKNICFEEIPREALLELTVKKYPYWRPNTNAEGQLNWKILYCTWLNWRDFNDIIYYVDKLSEHKSCGVTCLKLVDKSIVVGLYTGAINSWKALSGDPFLLSSHRASVTCLEVISVIDERKETKADKRLNYILSTSHDRMVKISHLIEEGMAPNYFDICHHHHSTIMVRAQQSYFATLDESGAVSVYVISAPNLDSIMPLVNAIAYLEPCVPPIQSLSIWGRTVTGMTKEGSILTTDFLLGLNNMKVLCSPENGEVDVTNVEKGSSGKTKINYYDGIGILQFYIWRQSIYMLITDDHSMLISLNGHHYHKYNLEKVFKTYPTTVLLYGNILILGMDSGDVVMYYFQTPEDLLSLDLHCYHWRHVITKKPVIGMDIWEGPSGPHLAILSLTDVHLIEWSFNLGDVSCSNLNL